jgi:hypothetical protein
MFPSAGVRTVNRLPDDERSLPIRLRRLGRVDTEKRDARNFVGDRLSHK